MTLDAHTHFELVKSNSNFVLSDKHKLIKIYILESGNMQKKQKEMNI